MTKINTFKKLSVDTNIIMGLALLYLRGEKEFIDANYASQKATKTTIKQYAEDLKYLQKCIDRHKIQVVLTPQVMYELNYRAKEFDENGNKVELTPETIARQKLKDLTIEYLKLMPKIKIAQISKTEREKFTTFTEKLIIEYVDSFHIFLKNLMGNAPSDARIIAQTTALGVDFISRDNHFNNKSVYAKHSKAEQIAMTNHNLGGHKTRIIPLSDLEPTMSNVGHNGNLIRKKYFAEPKAIVHSDFVSYQEYISGKELGM